MKIDNTTLERMTKDEARQIVAEINADISTVGDKLLELYDREGWKALGYSSWRDCVMMEFDFKQSHAYELLNFAKVNRTLADSAMAENLPLPTSERQARPLTKLPADEQASIWQEAVTTAPNGKVTASHVDSIVKNHLAKNKYTCTTCQEIFDTEVWHCPTCDHHWQMHQKECSNCYGKKLSQPMQVLLSHESVEYYTPSHIIEAAYNVMGKIDLDPASCIEAQEVVKAAKFFNENDDGLSQEWHGKIWLNPPYSKTGGKSNQELWSQYLISQYELGNIIEALLLVKATLGYKWFEELWDHWPVCFLRDRLSFIRNDGDNSGSSKYGTAIFYFGSNLDKFIDTFSSLGRITDPAGGYYIVNKEK